MKLMAVAVAGQGHRVTGSTGMVAAYAVSILVVERLFEMVEPKRSTLDWFAKAWTRFVALHRRMVDWFTRTKTSEPKPD